MLDLIRYNTKLWSIS